MQHIPPVRLRDELFTSHIKDLKHVKADLIISERELLRVLVYSHDAGEVGQIRELLQVESNLVVECLIKATFENYLTEVPNHILRFNFMFFVSLTQIFVLDHITAPTSPKSE